MADTKQATPPWDDEDYFQKPPDAAPRDALIGALQYWVRRAKKAENLLASRSGPDRTPDTVEYWKSRATTAELKVLTFHEEIAKLRSGPDRTTQETLSERINALPEWARQYIHDIETRCDPAGDIRTITELRDTIRCLEAGPDRGQQDAPDYPAILERERTLVAEGVSAVKKAIRCREWLTEGRGSYEWDDDRWHGEFAAAISEILTALAPLERVAADFSNCPQKWDDVLKARAVLAKAAREGQAPKGDRIKVEREPGCKCEYAIWTNAKGCPLHDVSDPVQAQKE